MKQDETLIVDSAMVAGTAGIFAVVNTEAIRNQLILLILRLRRRSNDLNSKENNPAFEQTNF